MTNLGQHRGWMTLAVVLVLGLFAAQSVRAQTLTVLYNFTGSPDGDSPYGGLVRDGSGNLYGTTYWGGVSGIGAVFKLDKTGNESVLHSFSGAPDADLPSSA